MAKDTIWLILNLKDELSQILQLSAEGINKQFINNLKTKAK
jgi:hypothetical protein